VSCCDTVEAPAVEEDPYEVEAEKMTNTIWESVSKMEDKDVRRDNAERTAAKLREIEDAEDNRESQKTKENLKKSALDEAEHLKDKTDKIKNKEDKKEKAGEI